MEVRMSESPSDKLEELIDRLNHCEPNEADLDRMMSLLDSPKLEEECANDPATPVFLENLRRPNYPGEPRCYCPEFKPSRVWKNAK
jgi:hypothetical protein